MTQLNRDMLASLLQAEEQLFYKTHPPPHKLYERARKSLHGGVPMLWMIRRAGSFPVFVKEAKGARFTYVDGNHYLDFCLGDTGAMTGHSPDRYVHLFALNRGILFAPFHNMALISPDITRDEADYHTQVFRDAVVSVCV